MRVWQSGMRKREKRVRREREREAREKDRAIERKLMGGWRCRREITEGTRREKESVYVCVCM